MFRQYRPFSSGEFIVVGVDTSTGVNDYCSAQFLSQKNLDIPLVFHSKVLATEMTNQLFPVLEKIYDTTGIAPVIAYERNNGGVFELERLSMINRNNKYRIYLTKNVGNVDNPDEKKIGWDTNGATRPHMLASLKEAVDTHLIKIYDKPTINEMFSFIIAKTSATQKAQAEVGAHDDLIMALAIAWQLYGTEHGRSEENYQVILARNRAQKKKWQIH